MTAEAIVGIVAIVVTILGSAFGGALYIGGKLQLFSDTSKKLDEHIEDDKKFHSDVTTSLEESTKAMTAVAVTLERHEQRLKAIER